MDENQKMDSKSDTGNGHETLGNDGEQSPQSAQSPESPESPPGKQQ